MLPRELLAELRNRQIELFLEQPGDRLRFRAPVGQLTEELRGQIRVHKATILQLLAAEAAGSAGATGPLAAGNDLPFTPNQIWYLETIRPQEVDWSNIITVEVAFRIEASCLQRTLAAIVTRHDIFRLRRYRKDDGSWAQRLTAVAEEPTVEILDFRNDPELRSLSIAEQRHRTVELGHRCQSRLSCVRGPILAVGVCLRSGPQRDQLVFAMHHFDGYSVSRFVSELVTAYQQLASGVAVNMPPVPVSYADYLRTLRGHCSTPQFLSQQTAYWTHDAQLRRRVPLPVDLEGGEPFVASVRALRASMPSGQRSAMAQYLVSHPDVHYQDLYIHGLVRAYGKWTSGLPLHLDIEHSGRAGLLPGLDLSRTLGPMTVKIPFWFATDPTRSPQESFAATISTLREGMAHALGHGFLRWLSPDPATRERLANAGAPEIFFNNRSSVLVAGQSEVSAVSAEPEWLPDPTKSRMTYAVIIECERTQDSTELVVSYSTALHYESTMRSLLDTMLTEIAILIEGRH